MTWPVVMNVVFQRLDVSLGGHCKKTVIDGPGPQDVKEHKEERPGRNGLGRSVRGGGNGVMVCWLLTPGPGAPVLPRSDHVLRLFSIWQIKIDAGVRPGPTMFDEHPADTIGPEGTVLARLVLPGK